MDAGQQGYSGAGIIPVSPCPFEFGLSTFQEVRPASSSFQLPKSISHCIIWTVAGSDVLKKGLFRQAFPNQVACISKPTRSLSVPHTWNAAGDLERNRLSHEASLWRPLTCKSTTVHEYRQAKLKGRIDCAGRSRSTYGAPTSHEPQARATIEKSREGTTFLPPAKLICSATGLNFENNPKLSSVGHFQSEQAFTPPTHFRMLFGFFRKVR